MSGTNNHQARPYTILDALKKRSSGDKPPVETAGSYLQTPVGGMSNDCLTCRHYVTPKS